MGKGTNTVTQQSAPPPQVMANYQEVMKRAQGDANRPLQQYGGGLLAGFNPTQQGAFQQTAQAAGAQRPYLQQATTYANMGAAPVFGQVDKFSGANVAKYQSPYTQQVINSTMANLNKNYGIQSNDLLGQGIAQGNAFGGDRMGVAQAELGRNQGLATGQTIAGLENQGYTQALGELNTQQNLEEQGLSADAWRKANAATQMGGLGAEAQQTGLAGASANMQVGGMQQQLQQEKLNIPYEMYQQQQAYPFQTTQFLGSLAGLGSGMGGSSSTTSPSPSLISQLGGLGLTGLGIAGETGALSGLFGGGASAALGGMSAATLAGLSSTAAADVAGTGLGGLATAALFDRGGRAGYDDGGAVALPATAAAAPGTDPMAQTQYQRLMAMSMEQLQHAAVAYPPSTAQGQLVARALQAKRMTPESNAPQPPMPQTGLAGGLNGGLQPQSMARGGFAGGGLAGQTLMPGYGTDPVEDVLGPPETGMMPMPDISGSQEGGSEDYQSGTAAGPYDDLSGSTPQAHGLGPGKYHLPQVAIDKSATHPPGGLGAGPDMSVTPHGGLGIPKPPDPASQADSSSPADTSGSATDAASSDAGSPDVAGGGGQTQAAPAPAAADAAPADEDAAPKDAVGDFLNSPWMPVIQAGLATMAGTSPFAAVNIGRGGLEGVQAAQSQRKQQAEMELTRAQAEGSKATADLNRMIVDAYKHMPGGAGGAVVSGAGGGGGGGATDVSAGGGGGEQPVTLAELAPLANQYTQASILASGLPGGVGRARSEALRAVAEMDPTYQHVQAMLKLGATAHRDGQGGFTWSMPADALNVQQQTELNKPHSATEPLFAYIGGQPVEIVSKTVDKAGKTTVTLHPLPQAGEQQQPPQQQPGAGDGAMSQVYGKQYAPMFAAAEKSAGLPPNMLAGQGYTESNYNRNAISPAGAQGLMQLMPGSQNGANAWEPRSAIARAAQIDAHLMQKYKNQGPVGSIMSTLAAYNMGEGATDKWLKTGGQFQRLPKETQAYIFNTMRHMLPADQQATATTVSDQQPLATTAAPQQATTAAPQQATPAAPQQQGAFGSISNVTEDPQSKAAAEERGKFYGTFPETFNKDSDAAFQSNATLNNMLQESRSWSPGKLAPIALELQQWGAALFPDDPSMLTSIADHIGFNKNVGIGVRQATRQLSVRAAVQEMQMVAKSYPSDVLPRQATVQMVTQMQGLNDWLIARNTVYGGKLLKDANGNPVSDENFMAAYQNTLTPAAFQFAELHRNYLQEGKGAPSGVILQGLVSNLKKTPEGRNTLLHLQQEAKFIEDNGLLPQGQ